MKIGIIGTGAYGLALASVFNENKMEVMMWTKFEEEKEELLLKKFTPKLPGFILPDNIEITNNLKKCVKDMDLIVIVVPTAFVGSASLQLKNHLKPNQHICIASKGIDQKDNKFLYDVVKENTKSDNIGVISGPSFAIDIIKKVPIGLSVASNNDKTIEVIKNSLQNSHFKLRQTKDIIGIEVCGSIKNIVAIASGIIDGMNLPISTKAFLITEALNDIKKLIKQLGGNQKTILSFAGFGDILLTCTSEKSRNYCLGQLIGKKCSTDEINNYIKTTTVEGVYTLESIHSLIREKNIDMPFINLIYDIIFNKKDCKELINFLIEK